MTMVAGLTAFYMFRMYYLVFWWEENPKYKQSGHKPHDAPWQMSLPLIILALVSCVAGFIHFGEFVTFNGEPYHIHIEASVAATSLTVAVLAIGLATLMYAKKNPLPSKVKNFWPALWTAANRRFYWDEIYRGIAWFDRHIIDGTMDAFASMTQWCSLKIKGMQSGSVQTYVLWYFAGAVILVVITWICIL